MEACVSLSAPGPHAFLVVVQLGRFTQEERDAVETLRAMFGEALGQFTMLLFTHGERLKGKAVEGFISKSDQLNEIVWRCHGRYHVLSNEAREPCSASQVGELLRKVDQMVAENGGGHYTQKMFRRAKKDTKRLSKDSSRRRIHRGSCLIL